jgi:hypothetical protein
MENEKSKNQFSDIGIVELGQVYGKSFSIDEVKQLSEIRIRAILIYTLLGLLIISTLSTFVLIFLKGYGKINISDGIIYTLIGASIADIVGVIISTVKYLFPDGSKK